MMGLGYIGLPTAAVIARSGSPVTGVDVSRKVVDTINRGAVHIEERDLDALVADMVEKGRLVAATAPVEADVFVIAVPTPFHDDGSHTPDISLVLAATEALAPCLRPGNLVILESTSPIGTTETIRDRLKSLRPDLTMPQAGGDSADLAIAYCPERVLPGKILEELVANDRSIGGITPRCAEQAVRFYETFVQGACTPTSAKTAEMVKLVENASRDVSIAFANELSLIADRNGLDVWEVIETANRHPRVNILQPGPGVGGHCIAVDPWFLVHAAPEQARLIRTAREVNDDKALYVQDRAARMLDDAPAAKMACLGLAFKPNIDDFRESPALSITAELAQRYGDRIVVVEPHCDGLPKALLDTGAVSADLDAALDQCDLVLLLVDHDEFRLVKADRLAGKTVYDTRGIWSRRDG